MAAVCVAWAKKIEIDEKVRFFQVNLKKTRFFKV